MVEENKYLRQQANGPFNFEHIVGKSPAMHKVYDQIRKVSHSKSTVLIRGETGTGKELIAGAIHHNSLRNSRNFVKVNCAALQENLLESELFGHEKGAFTGAHQQKRGKLEVAHGGTVFLDEIGDIRPALQAKLLRVLQDQIFERVGGTRPIQTDVRFVAATNRDLRAAVRDGLFRLDLYYRLDVGAIALVPLRQRTEDIEPLAHHFIAIFNEKMGRHVVGVAPQALDIFSRYPWPGNVRELANVIERAMVVCKGNMILPENLPPHVFETRPALPGDQLEMPDLSLQAAEREQILRALQASGGRRVEAARRLGLSRRTLYRKLSRYGISS